MANPKLLILYGSQTGTTQAFAKIVYAFAKARSFDARLCTGNEYNPADLPNEELVVILTSTFYNGEFPDNIAKFWSWLNNESHPASMLKQTRFTVFGLGNKTTKGNFCLAAKRIRDRMLDLGAFEVTPAVFSDEYSEHGHESNFRPWMKTLWVKLTGSNTKMSLPRHYSIKPSTQVFRIAERLQDGYVKLPVSGRELLTPAAYERPVYLMTFDLPQGQSYGLTDHIQIKCHNSPHLVERLAKRMGLDTNAQVELDPTDAIGEDMRLPNLLSVHRLLSQHLDISSPPSRSFLEGIAALAEDAGEAEKIEHFAEDMTASSEYSRLTGGGPGRQPFSLVDALERWPSVRITLEDLLGNIPLLQPRFYSICSAPSVSPNQIQICFLSDTWSSATDPSVVFQGVATGYLKDLQPNVDVVEARIVKGLLRLPADPKTPILAVALGTGVAVFRGILQHRAHLLDQDPSCGVSRIRLYYGMRHAQKDYLFKDELQDFVDRGLVEIIPACSHDQAKFITPADKILEFPTRVSEVLDNDGYYLYCGLGGLIPVYHESAIVSALQKAHESTSEEAYALVSDFKDAARWQVEAYSRSMDEDNQLKDLIAKDGVDQGKPIADVMGSGAMFCFQCGQTNQGKGCTTIGVCGKTPTVAALQDLLIECIKKLSWYAHRIRTLPGAAPEERESAKINRFTLLATFSTLTNVNFDEAKISEFISTASTCTEQLKHTYEQLCQKYGATAEVLALPNVKKQSQDALLDIEDLVAEGKKVGVLSRFRANKNDALVGLQEMLVYGLKGLCAYTDHSLQYENERPEIYAYVHEAFAFLLSPQAAKMDKVLEMLMRCGQVNITALELLHQSNNTFGAQSPAVAQAKPVPGKAILVSGHDLKILGDLLAQCADYKLRTGVHVNVFTHGEMLPAHGYPKLRESPHLAGHFGVAWQRQSIEFGHFPGPILMTSNCLTQPKDEYRDRIFTAGPVGWPKIPHIVGSDYSVVIEMAAKLGGFGAETKFSYPENVFTAATESYNVGWGSEVVIGAAGTVLDAVKAGLITRFYVIGGCDGYEGERSYYTDLAAALPDTSVVLTVGCGKYRINHLQYSNVGDSGIPRLLDLGQCNDSYSAVQIALALAGALNCGVNDLPLSIVLSWFEQKAVVVLLSLLSLGIRNIRVGPTVPAFLRPSIVKVLNEKFNLMPIGADPLEDIRKMVAGEA
ncbi:Prismane-like protein [Polychytrium aggregatum]|uniref:Prismane-like protein n=1 Tax=Polychytrium aggregatum TaxID=110093 RepID=UPI0022FF10A2|nr:Prismane-like protein [Polychytrium aggregatum]KAI9203852.1 Prismane-like protein [Polychytrium aggregatum]